MADSGLKTLSIRRGSLLKRICSLSMLFSEVKSEWWRVGIIDSGHQRQSRRIQLLAASLESGVNAYECGRGGIRALNPPDSLSFS